MKSIYETFDDEEHEQLSMAKKAKGFKNWHDFIMTLVPSKKK